MAPASKKYRDNFVLGGLVVAVLALALLPYSIAQTEGVSWQCQDAYRFSTVGQVPFKVIERLAAGEQPNGARCQKAVSDYVQNYAKNNIQSLVGTRNGPAQGGPQGAIFGSPRSVRGTDIGEIVFPQGASPPSGDFSRAFVNSVYYYVRPACSANVVRCGNGEISGSGSCSIQLTSVEPFCVKRQDFG
jgi:hypothetical protein